MKNVVFLGLGSNIEDRFEYINRAVLLFDEAKNCAIEKYSSVYESKPFGKSDQNNFLNAVIKIKTDLSVEDLLIFVKENEKKLGRIRREKWDSREIDIDILFYNDLIFSSEELIIPHPSIQQRDFVLIPLCEIESELIHPVLENKICDIRVSEKENYVINKFPKKIITNKHVSTRK